jgi:hypothetical protein
MTHVLNLYGGPGTGKSTTAAGLFAAMKSAGINCELVREYAKDVVWEGSTEILKDQIFVFANQLHRLNVLIGKVEYIITDSPILLSKMYASLSTMSLSSTTALLELVDAEHKGMHTTDIFLNRVKPYNPSGRLQSELEAIEFDATIKSLIPFKHYVNADADAPATIMKQLGLDKL